MKDNRIDRGREFDWGRVAGEYARYRDIYPQALYDRIHSFGIARAGQRILDLGTGTGVLPRNLYSGGASFIGADIAQEQIFQARVLSKKQGMDIRYIAVPAEKLVFPASCFDAVTACQCFFYFQHEILAPKVYSWLKPRGKLAVLYMAWLPYEDPIAERTEELILKYNPAWSGAGEIRRDIEIPAAYKAFFQIENNEVFDVKIPFTRESWEGRIKACRGVGASLEQPALGDFLKDHHKLLEKIAPPAFEVLHYCAVTVLKKI